MSETIYLLTICIPLGTMLVIFGMKYFARVQEARARLATDDAYRQLAAQAAASQAETAAALADLKSRLTAIEKMLKEVE